MYFVNELDFVCRDGWRSETPVGSPPSKFQDSGYIYFSLYKEVHVTSEHSVAKPEPPTKGGSASPFRKKLFYNIFVISMEKR